MKINFFDDGIFYEMLPAPFNFEVMKCEKLCRNFRNLMGTQTEEQKLSDMDYEYKECMITLLQYILRNEDNSKIEEFLKGLNYNDIQKLYQNFILIECIAFGRIQDDIQIVEFRKSFDTVTPDTKKNEAVSL